MRTALYARTRREDALDLPMQMEALETYARLKHWEVVLRASETNPGPTGRLPAREQVLAAARRGEIDLIVAWKVDRLARSLPEFLRMVEDLHAGGVDMASLADDLDLSGAQGPLIRHVLRVLASFRRHAEGEQVRLGIQRARREGRPIGRPATARARLDEIRALAAQGLSRQAIAERLGLSPRTVGRLLSEKD